VLTVTVFIKFI